MKDYIGDGVYVEFDGFGIKLRANSPDSPHVVYLEPQVLEALNRFAKRCAAQHSAQADVCHKSPSGKHIWQEDSIFDNCCYCGTRR